MRQATTLHRILGAAGSILNYYRQASVDLARIETAKAYVKMVRGIRKVCLGYLVVCCFVGFLFLAILILHAFLYLSMEDKTRALLIMLLVDGGITALLGVAAFSEQFWMKLFDVQKWLLDEKNYRENTPSKHF